MHKITSNIKELEDLEMDRLSVFMQDHLPYRTVFPSKEDFEEFPFEKLISDLRFFKESNLDYIRTTNQSISAIF